MAKVASSAYNAVGVMRPPVDAGVGSLLGAAGSLYGPLSIAATINNYFKSRRDARKAEAEAQYNQAFDTLLSAGINPFEVYSPDVVNEMLSTEEGMRDLAGIYPGDFMAGLESGTLDPYQISQELAFGMLGDALRNPGKYPASATPLTTADSPAQYGKDVLDTVVDILGNSGTLKGVVLGPGGVTGNVEWGGGTMPSAPGSDPAIYTGTYGNVNTGVTTGIPAVDAAIRRVLDQQVGGETTTVDVIVETAATVLGVPIDEAVDILKDTGVLVPSPSAPSASGGGGAPAATPPTPNATPAPTPDQTGGTTVGVGDNTLYGRILDWIRKNPEATDEQIRTAAEGAGVTPADIAGATGTDLDVVQRRWDDVATPAPSDSPTSTVLDNAPAPTITTSTPKSDAQEPGNLDVPPSTPVIDTPTAPAGGGGSGSPAFDALLPQYRTVTVTPGELAEIKYLYDVGGESIFAPMVEDDGNEDQKGAKIRDLYRGSYAQGGPVDIVELLLQRLRG